MLKLNVGLSRKLSENYNSHGFSINLEGEVGVDLRHTEAIVDKIQEYYDLADEALARQIERHESDSAIASHDAEPSEPPRREVAKAAPTQRTAPTNRLPNNEKPNGEPATNKQIQFLLNLGKRQGLSKSQLEEQIAERLGRTLTVYDLTKKEAGLILDTLTSQVTTAANAR